MRVRFTASGRIQFLAAIAYIRRDNPSAASRFRRDAERRLRRLKRFPMSGRHVPEFPDLPYREVIIVPYRFFHRVERETVWIVAVWAWSPTPGGVRRHNTGSDELMQGTRLRAAVRGTRSFRKYWSAGSGG